MQTAERSPAGSMDTGSHHHVLGTIVHGCFGVHDAAPFQELSTKAPTVGLNALKDEDGVIRQEERHHKAAENIFVTSSTMHV